MFCFAFKDRIVIVDSPGVGESEIMDDIVVNYLPNAFAFIYVINSGNAGGVQKDRVSVFNFSYYEPLNFAKQQIAKNFSRLITVKVAKEKCYICKWLMQF